MVNLKRVFAARRQSAILGLTLATLSWLAAAELLAREIAPEALEQIATLIEEKQARTAVEHKIDSHLLYELAARRDDVFLERLPDLRMERLAAADGSVLLDLDARVDDDLLLMIEALGGTVHSAFPRWNAVRVTLPIDRVHDLAGLDRVRSVRPADVYMTQMLDTTEGDVAHAADDARATFGVDGTGVKVGSMSDSVDALADLQASGDLPPGVTVLPGQSGNPGTSEGTALMEIVHDMAPGAELFFATGQGGQAQMAQNILDLAVAGCTVIVDDVLYFSEPVFQDGIIGQAVDTVAAAGVAYFSAAGNSGNLAAGTAGVWEGDYSGIALPGPLSGAGVSAHDFGGGTNNNELTFDTPFFITLQWSDASGASDNDYDLFLLDAALTTVVAASTNVQDGTQNPFEFIDSTASDDTANRIVVVQFDGDDRFIHLNTHRGQLATATDGQIFGHPAAEGAIAVAAVDVATAAGGEFTGGAANPVEAFSSDGPRRIFFEADGTPVPGRGVQPSEIRDVPDVAAADGVSTATPGFNPFFGTSAAAPHGAGIAALIKEMLSSLNAVGMDQRTRRDALDIEDPGDDKVSGSGIPMADDAIDGKLGFQNDNFSARTALSGIGVADCLFPQGSGIGNNEAEFDALFEALEEFDDGTQPFVFEFETDPDGLSSGGRSSEVSPQTAKPASAAWATKDSTRAPSTWSPKATGDEEGFEAEINIGAEPGDDLFPEGFEDPKTGTPLDAACVEIGIDDTLDSDCPVEVTSAVLQFGTPSGPLGEPLDVTSQFPANFWDGKISIPIPGLTGMGINSVKIRLTMQESSGPNLFADGFETGDTSSWTSQTP